MIHTIPSEDDAEGPLHQVVAELDAARAGVRRAKESMVTEGVHGSLTTRATEIRREHLHRMAILQESREVAHASGLLQPRNWYTEKLVMSASLLKKVQDSTKPRHKRGLDVIEKLSRHRDKELLRQ